MILHSASRAKELASRLVKNNPADALILIELLEGLLDPDGEALRYSAGEETMRYLYTMTPQFEDAFNSFVHGRQSAIKQVPSSP